MKSNKFIIGISGDSHPYLIYEKYGVPIVISTDDLGTLRTNLSEQYVLLADQYKPKYSKIKEYVYNSITYSFLTDKEKHRIKNDLNKRFEKFEGKMADLYDEMK